MKGQRAILPAALLVAGLALPATSAAIVDTPTHSLTPLVGDGSACVPSATPPSCGDGGSSAAAQITAPGDMVISPDGKYLYIAEPSNHRVRRVNLTTGKIETYVGSPAGVACDLDTNPSCNDGRSRTSALLQIPSGLAVDSNGDLYISEYSKVASSISVDTGRVRKVDALSGIVTTVAGCWPVNTTSGSCARDKANGLVRMKNGYPGPPNEVNPTTTNTTLLGPMDIAIDPVSRSLYIADNNDPNNQASVKRVGLTGNIYKYVLNEQVYNSLWYEEKRCIPNAYPRALYADGNPSNKAASNALMCEPASLAVDPLSHDLYVAERQGVRIRHIDASSGLAANRYADKDDGAEVLAGSGSRCNVYGNRLCPEPAAGSEVAKNYDLGSLDQIFLSPSDGSLLFSERGCSATHSCPLNFVRKVVPSNGILNPDSSPIDYVFIGDIGNEVPAIDANIQKATGLAVASDGKKLIADEGRNQVLMLETYSPPPPPPPPPPPGPYDVPCEQAGNCPPPDNGDGTGTGTTTSCKAADVTVKLKLRPKMKARELKKGLKLAISSSRAGTRVVLTATTKAGKKVKLKGKATLKRAGKFVAVRLKAKKKALRSLARSRKPLKIAITGSYQAKVEGKLLKGKIKAKSKASRKKLSRKAAKRSRTITSKSNKPCAN